MLGLRRRDGEPGSIEHAHGARLTVAADAPRERSTPGPPLGVVVCCDRAIGRIGSGIADVEVRARVPLCRGSAALRGIWRRGQADEDERRAPPEPEAGRYDDIIRHSSQGKDPVCASSAPCPLQASQRLTAWCARYDHTFVRHADRFEIAIRLGFSLAVNTTRRRVVSGSLLRDASAPSRNQRVALARAAVAPRESSRHARRLSRRASGTPSPREGSRTSS